MKKTFLVSSFIFFILLLTSCTIGHHVNNMTSYMESVDGLHYSLTPKLYYFDKLQYYYINFAKLCQDFLIII